MSEYAYEVPQRATRLYCPIGACKWTWDDPGPSGTVASDRDIRDVLLAHAVATESVVREHLDAHSLLEWVQEVMRLRDDRAMGIRRSDLQQVYEYARHFDVDSDPSMMRTRALLGLA